ncbi:MAG: alanine racemase [Deltaproteobacteria bacterium]|nr:alanine racemase [Deltaproteobacteria bacterium]
MDPPSLAQRFRPTIARIDLSALRHNVRLLRGRLPADCGLLVPVKADAYGHGLLPVSRVLEEEGAEWLGVALVEEGLALRKGGIQSNILVLGGLADGSEALAVESGLTPVVYRSPSVRALNAMAARLGRTVQVHLKVDTGMNRLGVPVGHLDAFLDLLDGLEHITIQGVMTHLAEAEDARGPFTEAQLVSFEAAVALVRRRGHSPHWLHAANSAAVMNRRGTDHLDLDDFARALVRPGLAVFGHPPDASLDGAWPLRPVMSFETAISYLKKVPAGSEVSYGRSWRAQRETKLATLPVGYGDGYFRAFGNSAQVLVRGMRVPVVGRVCMDLCLLDVTDVPHVAEGDRAVLLGTMGEAEVTASELAAIAGTIPYEIVCAVSPRVPRVYEQGRPD